MKKNLSYGIAAVVLVALLAAAGCSNPLTGEREPEFSDEGRVVLRFSDLRAMNIVPEISLDIENYVVSFTRQGHQPVTLPDIGGDVTETEPVRLLPGPWQVSVSAFNDEGTLIGFAEAAVSVSARRTSTVSMAIQSLVGDGTLSLTADLNELDLLDPEISGTLISGASGAVTDIGMPITGSSASFEGDLAAGTYLLTLELVEAGTSIASYVNTALIVFEQTTSAALVFRPAAGSVVVELVNEITRPITITLEGLQPELGPAQSMTVAAVTATAVDTYQWYLDGVKLPGEVNQAITLGAELFEGEYLLTVVVRKGAVYSAQAGEFMNFELITYRRQSRYVNAISGEHQRFDSKGYEDFDATATSTHKPETVAPDDYTDTYTAYATQTSTLAADRILAAGRADEEGPFYALENHSQEAESFFSVSFTLNQGAEVRLTGELHAQFDSGGTNVGPSVAAVLFNGGEPIFEATVPDQDPHWDDWGEIDISETLTLGPGDYALRVYASAACDYYGGPPGHEVGGGGRAEYSIELTIVDVF